VPGIGRAVGFAPGKGLEQTLSPPVQGRWGRFHFETIKNHPFRRNPEEAIRVANPAALWQYYFF
jgi:hypothetical protein